MLFFETVVAKNFDLRCVLRPSINGAGKHVSNPEYKCLAPVPCMMQIDVLYHANTMPLCFYHQIDVLYVPAHLPSSEHNGAASSGGCVRAYTY